MPGPQDEKQQDGGSSPFLAVTRPLFHQPTNKHAGYPEDVPVILEGAKNMTQKRTICKCLLVLLILIVLVFVREFGRPHTYRSGSMVSRKNQTLAGEGCDDSLESGTRYPGVRVEDDLKLHIQDCAQRLELPGHICDPKKPIRDNSYQVPYMSSGDLACGFETIIAKKGMDELAARYEFNFIGASTTRRLAESFASIYTGIAPSHVVYHKPQAYSSGNLKVSFDWAPMCAGPQGVGVSVKRALDQYERTSSSGPKKRLVIITAYGIHDATYIRDYQNLNLSVIAPDGNGTRLYDTYTAAREHKVLAHDDCSDASFASCEQVTSELLRVARDRHARPKEQHFWRRGWGMYAIQKGRDEARKGTPQGVNGMGTRTVDKASHVSDINVSRKGISWDERTISATKAREEATIKTAAEGAQEEGAIDEEPGGNRRRLGDGGKGGGYRRESPVGGVVDGKHRHTQAAEGRQEKGGTMEGGADDEAQEVFVAKGLPSSAFNAGYPEEFNSTQRLLNTRVVRNGARDDTQSRGNSSAVGQVETLSPLIFLFQGNPFLETDPRDAWLKKLHTMQRQKIEGEGISAGPKPANTRCAASTGMMSPSEESEASPVILLNDQRSLFERTSCYRADDIHFLEPVKLIEGKMLWHLLKLADKGASTGV